MPKKYARHTIYVHEEHEAPLRRLVHIKGEQNLSAALNSLTARYLDVIAQSIPKNLTDEEWCLVFDALKAPWTPDGQLVHDVVEEIGNAIDADGLELKWGIDGKSLLSKLRKLSYAQKQAVGELAETFWAMDLAQDYSEVIKLVMAAFRPMQSTQPPRGTRRMNRNRLSTIGLKETSALEERVTSSRSQDRVIHKEDEASPTKVQDEGTRGLAFPASQDVTGQSQPEPPTGTEYEELGAEPNPNEESETVDTWPQTTQGQRYWDPDTTQTISG